VPGGAALPPMIAHIAPDPMEPGFDEAAVTARLRSRRTGIKAACSISPWSAASATSTRTRPCGGRGCTGPRPPPRSAGPSRPGCWPPCVRSWARRWRPAARRSTACT
jgi:hypothetical protein